MSSRWSRRWGPEKCVWSQQVTRTVAICSETRSPVSQCVPTKTIAGRAFGLLSVSLCLLGFPTEVGNPNRHRLTLSNPNARPAIVFVGTHWETGLRVSLQMATVLVTCCDQTHFSGPYRTC